MKGKGKLFILDQDGHWQMLTNVCVLKSKPRSQRSVSSAGMLNVVPGPFPSPGLDWLPSSSHQCVLFSS